MTNNDLLQEANAIKYATDNHGDAKYGHVYPYFVHLHHVVGVAREFGFNDPAIIQSCWLHDVMEDTAVHYNDLKELFGHEVAEAVYAVTDEMGKNRKERHEKTYPKIRASRNGTIVKLCDRIANMRFSLVTGTGQGAMCVKEWPEFRAALEDAENAVVAPLWAECRRILGVGPDGKMGW